jgi:hypothetical protein
MTRYQAPKDASARSPFAGCAILIAALLVMVFLIVFSTVTLFRQSNEIAKFTAEKPVPVALCPLENQEAALNALAERLESFRQQLAGDDPAMLALTPGEMNLAIAAYEPLRDLRGTLRIAGVEGDSLRIAIAFPLNGKPRLARKGETGWITSDPRYLNATLSARPVLLKREVVLQLDSIDVSGAEVPREFIEQMSPYRITERYLTDPVLGPAMAKLTRVGIADGKIVFTRIPGEVPADVIGKAQVDSASKRLFRVLGGVACAFLVIAGGVVFLGLRAKAARW